MSQKVALVTGCSEGGMGYWFCVELAKKGYTVYATSRRIESMKGLKEAGCKVHEMDVTSKEAIERVHEIIKIESGRLDLFVQNAGLTAGIGPLLTLDVEKGMKTFEANFWGPVRCVQQFAPLMIETFKKDGSKIKTRIIQVGSVWGEFG
ncbi:NAD(P)-binding protein, partial [Atractiella rhizophila]